MKVFVVYCHPSEDSFTRHVRDAFIKGVVDSGHDYELSDLYKMNFQADMTEKEYLRDKNAGLPIEIAKNYYPDDDDTKEPMVTWRSHANLLYANWLNYMVYQTTPYDIKTITR